MHNPTHRLTSPAGFVKTKNRAFLPPHSKIYIYTYFKLLPNLRYDELNYVPSSSRYISCCTLT